MLCLSRGGGSNDDDDDDERERVFFKMNLIIFVKWNSIVSSSTLSVRKLIQSQVKQLAFLASKTWALVMTVCWVRLKQLVKRLNAKKKKKYTFLYRDKIENMMWTFMRFPLHLIASILSFLILLSSLLKVFNSLARLCVFIYIQPFLMWYVFSEWKHNKLIFLWVIFTRI